jgi:hypothetical protein
MATTTNYGWTTPDDTSLVKDGAAAIRTLGSSVDTTTKALNPSTTLGDIEYRSSTANTNTRLGIGSTGTVLTVAGGVPTWAAPAGGGATLAQIASATLSGATVTISSLSAYDTLIIQFRNVDMSSVTGFSLLVNNNTGAANYNWNGFNVSPTTSGGATQKVTRAGFMPYYQGNLPASSQDNDSGFTLTNCKAAGFTSASWVSGYQNSNAAFQAEAAQGQYLVAEAVSSLVFSANAGTFDGGTYTIWGG